MYLILFRSESSSRSWKSQTDYTCRECGKSYSSSSNLARHRQTHRSLSQDPSEAIPAGVQQLHCPTCGREYSSPAALAMHLRTHGAGCSCPHCGKSFSRPWLLQGHIRTHTGEKPFRCHVCAKTFADKSNLRAHVQTHSTDKPFSCANCGKSFALKSYLSKHEESSCFKSGRTGGRRSRQPSISTSPTMTMSEDDNAMGGLLRPHSASPTLSLPFTPSVSLLPPTQLGQISEATLNAIRKAVEAHKAGLAAC